MSVRVGTISGGIRVSAVSVSTETVVMSGVVVVRVSQAIRLSVRVSSIVTKLAFGFSISFGFGNSFAIGLTFSFSLTLVQSVVAISVVAVAAIVVAVVTESVRVGTITSISVWPEAITSIAVVLRFGLRFGSHNGKEGSNDDLNFKYEQNELTQQFLITKIYAYQEFHVCGSSWLVAVK